MSVKPLVGSSLTLVTLGLALGTFMQVLDTTITNVSIPAIAGDLAASPNQGTWAITSFAVSNAILLPLTGWLARRVGEVKLFVMATLLFTLASWACGLATSLPMLIFFRVIQGAVAGPMIPLSQSLLLANYPNDKKGMALALWSMTVIVAPIFGPILGGWITDNLSWPWIFYINIPVGFFSAFITWQLLKDRESSLSRTPIDTVGLMLLIIGVGCLQIVLDKGNELDWFSSDFIATLSVVAAMSLSVFIAWELTTAHPIVDLHLFRKRNFAIGTITLSLAYLTFFGNVVILPLWLQTQMEYTATWAGLAAAPIGLLSLVFSPLVGKNLHRVDLRLFAIFSFLIFAGVSFWTSHFTTDIDYMQLFVPRFIQGLGVACFFVPLSSMSLSELTPRELASGAGLTNFLRIVAGSFGTSLSISLWEHRSSLHYGQLAEHVTASSPATLQTLETLRATGVTTESAMAILSRMMTKQAVMLATDDIFWLSGCIFCALILVVWLARPPFRAAGAAVAE